MVAPQWRRLNPDFARTAYGLGIGPWRVFWQVKLIMLRPALAMGLAVGFAVSLAQYLPTLLLGGGRVPSLTLEAVALTLGADRHYGAFNGLLLGVLPLIGFWLASHVSAKKVAA